MKLINTIDIGKKLYANPFAYSHKSLNFFLKGDRLLLFQL